MLGDRLNRLSPGLGAGPGVFAPACSGSAQQVGSGAGPALPEGPGVRMCWGKGPWRPLGHHHPLRLVFGFILDRKWICSNRPS